ncbi:hypothetical protein [Aliidiomarina indica]|uniref:hypothetical protein n=1 Tax=Aliidiomarina indica TaxID=2749147 RepID=UPI001890B115|nr:hypothetical protein [Aliidiomarina indica]
MNVLEFMKNPDLCGGSFTGDSWQAWEAVLSGAFALPMDDDTLEKFKALAGDREPPAERVRELWVIAGRRSAKSHVASAIAVYLATVGVELENLTERLSIGERGVIAVIANTKEQAGVAFGYMRGLFEYSPALSSMVTRYTTDSIELNNRVTIRVTAASYRTVRSATLLAVLFDEAAFFRSESTALPDEELYRAAVPGLATTGGLLIGISSPYAKRGLMYRKFQKHYGKNDDVLFVKGGTKDFNPTLDKSVIDRDLEQDPEAAAAEWLGEFRSDIASFIDRELISELMRSKPVELPFDRSKTYVGFADPAGGGKDTYTLAIGHREPDGSVVVDVLRGMKGQPAEITAVYAELLKEYKVRLIHSDGYAGSWPADEFKKHGITLVKSDEFRTGLYQFALPVLNTGRVELPPSQTLLNEFANLERRIRPSGQMVIDHPKGLHDDHANAVAGLIYVASKKRQPTSSVRIAF